MESIRRSARDKKEEFLLVSIMHSKRQCEKLSSANNAANKVFAFPKYFSKMKNDVSQSSEGVVRATGCFYDPEIMLPNG